MVERLPIRIERGTEGYDACTGTCFANGHTKAEALYALLTAFGGMIEIVDPYIVNSSFSNELLAAIFGGPSAEERDARDEALGMPSPCDYLLDGWPLEIVAGRTHDGRFVASIRASRSSAPAGTPARSEQTGRSWPRPKEECWPASSR